MEDLVVYKKVAQIHFTATKVIPDEGEINIRELTAAVLQRSKENKKQDFLLKYLKDHLTVLQNIASVQGLKFNKEHGRRVDEQSKVEYFENDSNIDELGEKAFRANVTKSKKQLVGTLRIDMKSLSGRKAQADYNEKVGKKVGERFPDKITACKLQCGEKPCFKREHEIF